uniref:MBD_C domain-containing protein n=1 Tax=Steinernema glaseri TaxID=37863 RepID=A0A1I7ZCF8_9BILA
MGRPKKSEAGNLNLKKGKKNASRSNANSRTGFDGPTTAPYRKTVSIFKQPVTLVHTTSRESKAATNEQLRRGTAMAHGAAAREARPRQIFWTKCFDNISAMVPINRAERVNVEDNEHIPQKLTLPIKTETVISTISEEAAAASLVSTMCSGELDVQGQKATKKQIESNPAVNLNVDQPFVQLNSLTDQDIVTQERRVIDARKRLSELRRQYAIDV